MLDQSTSFCRTLKGKCKKPPAQPRASKQAYSPPTLRQVKLFQTEGGNAALSENDSGYIS